MVAEKKWNCNKIHHFIFLVENYYENAEVIEKYLCEESSMKRGWRPIQIQ